jgi:predicted RNA binding protein YcfA (HicA-like mRNA interferase family)
LPKLPRCTGRELISALKRLGFREIRSRGSHFTLFHPETGAICTVPVHAGEIVALKTLQTIINQAGITIETLQRAL